MFFKASISKAAKMLEKDNNSSKTYAQKTAIYKFLAMIFLFSKLFFHFLYSFFKFVLWIDYCQLLLGKNMNYSKNNFEDKIIYLTKHNENLNLIDFVCLKKHQLYTKFRKNLLLGEEIAR